MDKRLPAAVAALENYDLKHLRKAVYAAKTPQARATAVNAWTAAKEQLPTPALRLLENVRACEDKSKLEDVAMADTLKLIASRGTPVDRVDVARKAFDLATVKGATERESLALIDA
ncbi:MAG: hypothetical protein M3N08_07660, partial [Pseudomonadota bacterium]|nr:hypothetical protein [Pseudomonadota bacterium]